MFTFPIAFFSSSGSTPPAEAFSNYYSTDFGGLNDYVNLGDSDSFSFGNGSTDSAFSISAWIYRDGTTNDGIVAKDASSNREWAFYIYSGTLRMVLFDNSSGGYIGRRYGSTITNGEWHHVAATYDGGGAASDIKLYLNGTQVDNQDNSSGSYTAMENKGAEVRIGSKESDPLYFDGKIDEVAIFDSELSASDVTAIYNSGSPDSLASQSNLKGWWRMGDGANYPIIKNQAHFSQTALEFDGIDDYVDLGDVFDYGTFSISAWVKADALSASLYEGIIAKRGASNPSKQFNLSLDNANKFYFWIFQSDGTYIDIFSNSAIVVDTWYHVLAVADGSTLKMYVNGTLQTDTASYDGTFQNTGSTTKIGDNQGHLWTGKIDDVAFYNNDQSSNVADIYNSGYPKDESERSGLVAYYKFDGDVYPVVRDALQFSNASLDFDGLDDYVNLNNGASVNPSSIVSLSCWVNFDVLSNYDGIFGKRMGSTVTMPFLLSLDNSSKIRFRIAQSNNTTKEIYTNSAVSTNTWYHVVGVADGTNIKLYLDGTLQTDTDTYDGTLKQSTADDVYIGRNASDYLNGKVSDAIIFSSALSASDVTGIYNSGKPKDESSTSNILGYWRLGDNTISPNVPSALGYGTHSVEFDGALDHINCGNNNAFEYDDAFSISCWVKHDYTTNRTYVSKIKPDDGSIRDRGYYIGTITGAKWIFWIASNYWGTKYMQVESTTSVTSNTWHHVVATYDGSGNRSGMNIYINGTAETLTTAGATSLSDTIVSSDPLKIGVKESSNYMAGHIAQVGIFNAELSASDVTSIYNSGKTKDLSSESNLVSYWRMGDGEDKYPNILDYKGTAHGTMTNMASDDITTDNVGSGAMTNMASDVIVADSPSGTSGQMTDMASDAFVAAKEAGTMTNMDAEGIVASTPS